MTFSVLLFAVPVALADDAADCTRRGCDWSGPTGCLGHVLRDECPYPELQVQGPGAAALKPLPSRKSAVLGIEELRMPAPDGRGSIWIMKTEVSQRLEMAVRARLPAWDAPSPLVHQHPTVDDRGQRGRGL